jgi:hypothetical protein
MMVDKMQRLFENTDPQEVVTVISDDAQVGGKGVCPHSFFICLSHATVKVNRITFLPALLPQGGVRNESSNESSNNMMDPYQ